MKKALAIMLAIMISAVFLASCSSKSNDSQSFADSGSGYTGSAPRSSSGAASSAPYTGELYDSYDEGGDYVLEYSLSKPMEAGVAPIANSSGANNLADKIIYTINADIETVDYDASIDEVYNLLSVFDAFIENSYVGGRNYAQSYYGWQTYRSASFTLRVPKDRLDSITESLSVLGNVVSRQSNAENITFQFSDTQSRLASYKTQEERLLDMLGKAESVTDMITIEERLGEVRYSIETLTSTLTNWQNQVDYSTLNLNIREVEKYTEVVPIQRTYWQQIGDGIVSTTRDVGDFFKGLLKWVIVSLPVLIILAVIAIVVIILVRRSIRRKRNAPAQSGNINYPGNSYPNNYYANNNVNNASYVNNANNAYNANNINNANNNPDNSPGGNLVNNPGNSPDNNPGNIPDNSADNNSGGAI